MKRTNETFGFTQKVACNGDVYKFHDIKNNYFLNGFKTNKRAS